ncbi:MAG TPA: hypothetical protein VFU74_09860 [Actinocrinis sp.]|nr:hypothetical protein [Actinocrinis sp.]
MSYSRRNSPGDRVDFHTLTLVTDGSGEHSIDFVIAQDLVYNQLHLFLGNNDIAGWQRAIERLAAADGYDTVLVGHGLPTGPEVFPEVANYLTDARELLGEDGEAYKKAIVDRYPAYGGAFLIDIANRYLFGTGH